ncbi:ras GTPase-activating protein 1-like [Coturnix japonica]|uniref:ras GTPase-activating protein 1-like n=1 Tax=Coturnix japonica TaxID=93934 RepID=UPI0013A5E7E8|nr:ras GTPase-activating protein 1-like [Coturnix japonica]
METHSAQAQSRTAQPFPFLYTSPSYWLRRHIRQQYGGARLVGRRAGRGGGNGGRAGGVRARPPFCVCGGSRPASLPVTTGPVPGAVGAARARTLRCTGRSRVRPVRRCGAPGGAGASAGRCAAAAAAAAPRAMAANECGAASSASCSIAPILPSVTQQRLSPFAVPIPPSAPRPVPPPQERLWGAPEEEEAGKRVEPLDERIAAASKALREV